MHRKNPELIFAHAGKCCLESMIQDYLALNWQVKIKLFEMFTSVVILKIMFHFQKQGQANIFYDLTIFISLAKTWTETAELGLLNFNLNTC